MKKKTLAVVLAVVMAMSLSACGSTSEAPSEEAAVEEAAASSETAAPEESTSAENGKLIGVSVADQSNVFYIDILDGMETATKEGDQLVVMDAGFDAAKQLDDIEDMINQGVEVMLIDPVDSNAIKTSLDACAEAGVPVICYNSPVVAELQDKVASTVASDNYMAGQLVGKALAENIGGKGEVAMLTYNVAEVCLDRANGFIDALAEYPDIEIVEQQEIEPGTDTALPVAENILQAYPNLVGFFALNDPSALGIVAAAETAGMLEQLTIVGVDGSSEAKTSILNDKMYASAAQFPVDIGSMAVEAAYSVMDGGNVEKDIKVDVGLVDKSNANE